MAEDKKERGNIPPRRPPAPVERDHQTPPAVNPAQPKAQAQPQVPPVNRPAPRPTRTHTVKDGETLSHIALKYYGSAIRDKWMVIYEANQAAIGDDPGRIRVGQMLVIPDLVETPKPGRIHKVQPDETLSHIALKYYGSAIRDQWMRIYEANKEIIGDNPGILRPGLELVIPE